MQTFIVGPFHIKHEPAIELATVCKTGVLVPEIVFTANGYHALSDAEDWCYSQPGMPRQISHGVEQLTKAEAKAMFDSREWENWTLEEIATFQLFQNRLVVPFDKFQEAMEHVLNRPVFTHEFGLNWEGLIAEYWGEKPKPTFNEILELIPKEKRIVVFPAENFITHSNPEDIPDV